ncbi:MAG: YezD family protein [Gammaproteobacteria bacterium]
MQSNRAKVPLGTGQTPSLSVEDIRLALQGLYYGAVEITVHNGEIVQIERKEKLRASAAAPARR